MTSRFEIFCTGCGAIAPSSYAPFCPTCRAHTDVRYNTDRCSLIDSDNPYERFRDLLPLHDPSVLPTDATATPLIHAEQLGAELGLERLYLKDETANPTSSTKDRMAAVALAFLSERGVEQFATSSTGNSSSAFAREMLRYPQMHMSLFTAEDWVHRVQGADAGNVTSYALRDATFVEAFEQAKVFAAERGLTPERGFFNPGRREGLKLAFAEACDQTSQPFDWYVQAVSSAMGVVGTMNAAHQLHAMGRIDRTPRPLCVQQESCSPMAQAWAEGSLTIAPHHIVERPAGIAQAILRGNPSKTYPIVRRLMTANNGAIVAASESEIRDAQAQIAELEGVDACFAAAAAVAGLARHAASGHVAPDASIIVNLTGGDRPSGSEIGAPIWLERVGDQWLPEGAAAALIEADLDVAG